MRALILLPVLLLGACTLVPDSAEEAALRERPQAARVHADLVRGMMKRGQYYAALAHVEELARDASVSADEVGLLRAQCLYHLDQYSAARAQFTALTDGRFAGEAYHGLGLVEIHHDLARAVRHLNTALRLRPTNAELRNDLGYALMMAGRMPEARHHLATAAELDPGGLKASNNLVLSYLVDKDEATARNVARDAGVDEAEMLVLRREASLLRRVIAQRAAEFTAGARGKGQE